MAIISRGETFTDTVTAVMLHNLVDNATVSEINSADIANAAVSDMHICPSAQIDLTKIGESGIANIKRFIWLDTPAVVLDVASSSNVDYTELDMTGVCGADVKAVFCGIRMKDTGAGFRSIHLRPLGCLESIPQQWGAMTQVAGIYAYASFLLPCGTDGKIEYRVVASGYGTAEYQVNVFGYIEDVD